MVNFTLIFRDLTSGMTGWHHATAEDLSDANETFESTVGDVELVGAFEGHVTPLWWEE